MALLLKLLCPTLIIVSAMDWWNQQNNPPNPTNHRTLQPLPEFEESSMPYHHGPYEGSSMPDTQWAASSSEVASDASSYGAATSYGGYPTSQPSTGNSLAVYPPYQSTLGTSGVAMPGYWSPYNSGVAFDQHAYTTATYGQYGESTNVHQSAPMLTSAGGIFSSAASDICFGSNSSGLSSLDVSTFNFGSCSGSSMKPIDAFINELKNDPGRVKRAIDVYGGKKKKFAFLELFSDYTKADFNYESIDKIKEIFDLKKATTTIDDWLISLDSRVKIAKKIKQLQVNEGKSVKDALSRYNGKGKYQKVSAFLELFNGFKGDDIDITASHQISKLFGESSTSQTLRNWRKDLDNKKSSAWKYVRKD